MIKTIGLIAPSGNIRNLDIINQKIKILEKNFIVKKFYNENISNGYLADSDENRIKYFEQAFSDKDTDLIISIRGGFGAIKIVDKINYDLIKNCNKIYLGSSDATIFLIALSKNTNVKCFHSLMISNGFVENLDKNCEIIENNLFNLDLKPIKKGNLKGKLWGGNLSSIVSMLSNDKYLPDENIILFLEDLNEPIYKIDKMLYEIYRCKNLKEKIKGIIFGDFYFKIEEIKFLFEEYAELFNVASYYNFNITHKENNITLPFNKSLNIN